MRHLFALLLFYVAATLPIGGAQAAPLNYQLDAAHSKVGFVYTLSGNAGEGTMPIKSANIQIDRSNLRRSSVDVTVIAAKARTGLFFATEALKAKSVLDTRSHPTIRFVSTGVRLNGAGQLADGAKIDGLLTIKGVTRPVTLTAALFRPKGSAEGDLSKLSFRLKGVVDRTEFGANGYSVLVAPQIRLDIVARVNQVP